MKKYLVGVQETLIDHIEIEAESEEGAREEVFKMIDDGYEMEGQATDGVVVFDVIEI